MAPMPGPRASQAVGGELSRTVADRLGPEMVEGLAVLGAHRIR